MKAESCPAVMDNMTPDTPECDSRLKICGYNDRRDESEVMEMNVPVHQSFKNSQKKEALFQDIKNSAADDFFTLPEVDLCPESYMDLGISSEDELSLMTLYLAAAKTDCSDVSELLLLRKTAEKRYESGDTDGFYDLVDCFYNLYEDLCKGKGGRLYVSGDYLSFSYEPAKVGFSAFCL